MLGQALLVIATVAIFHGASSTYADLSHLKALGRPEGALPFDIYLEAFLALALGIVGACLKAPAPKEITWASEMKKMTIDDMDSRMGFASFVNRGNVLGKEPEPAEAEVEKS
ncbi:hypothetical protein DENSPDRAFT_836049 [Dentipellis sp. KUC8613]|nr:hypothetical protein DENSPDRAFT_836049 [Dentipellis sp. KUC8613]